VQVGENANRQETEDDSDSAKLGHRLAMPAVSARLDQPRLAFAQMQDAAGEPSRDQRRNKGREN